MKVKILVSCSGLKLSYSEGQIAEVDKDIGEDLVKVGFAEEIKDTAAVEKADIPEKAKPTIDVKAKSKRDTKQKQKTAAENGDSNAGT